MKSFTDSKIKRSETWIVNGFESGHCESNLNRYPAIQLYNILSTYCSSKESHLWTDCWGLFSTPKSEPLSCMNILRELRSAIPAVFVNLVDPHSIQSIASGLQFNEPTWCDWKPWEQKCPGWRKSITGRKRGRLNGLHLSWIQWLCKCLNKNSITLTWTIASKYYQVLLLSQNEIVLNLPLPLGSLERERTVFFTRLSLNVDNFYNANNLCVLKRINHSLHPKRGSTSTSHVLQPRFHQMVQFGLVWFTRSVWLAFPPTMNCWSHTCAQNRKSLNQTTRNKQVNLTPHWLY